MWFLLWTRCDDNANEGTYVGTVTKGTLNRQVSLYITDEQYKDYLELDELHQRIEDAAVWLLNFPWTFPKLSPNAP